MSKPSPDKAAKGARITNTARALARDVRENGKCLNNSQAVKLLEFALFIQGKASRHINRTLRQSRGGAVKDQK